MDQQQIQLRQIRDFGQNISDTFQFIKQEFKPLISSFLLLAGVFIIAYGIAFGMFESNFLSVFRMLDRNNNTYDPQTAFQSIFSLNYFIILFLAVFNFSAMCVAVASYLKVYNEKGNSPVFNEVWGVFKKNIVVVFLFSIVAWIVIITGCCFCLVPGIYFAVVLAPFEIVIVMEGRSFGHAFSRCFALIKDNFWVSFGIYIISYLIYYFCSLIVGFMIGLAAGLVSYFTTKNIVSTVGIVTGILGVFSQFFFLILYISISLNYFSMAEKLDGTGILERLQTIGTDINPNENIEEQY
jgi:hypothetical protein